MYSLITRVVSAVDATFGTCSICMRQALVAALTAWGIYVVLWLIWPNGLVLALLGLAVLVRKYSLSA